MRNFFWLGSLKRKKSTTAIHTIPTNNIKNLNVYVRKIGCEDCFEIDSIEDLKNVEKKCQNILLNSISYGKIY